MSDDDKDRWCRWFWVAFSLAMLAILLPAAWKASPLLAVAALAAAALLPRVEWPLGVPDRRPVWKQTLDALMLIAVGSAIVFVFMLVFVLPVK